MPATAGADENFDFSNAENVDCLACHADAAKYSQGRIRQPGRRHRPGCGCAKRAQLPTRENCGKCHFDGGGGNNVKHGDLDESLYFPPESLDVHMGEQDFLCTDCHQTNDHVIKGRLLADNYTIDPEEQVACTDCHSGDIPRRRAHQHPHCHTVACQTCHIPDMALKDPTKVTWDWSTAGQDQPDDHYTYLKIKGNFIYEENVEPTTCGSTAITPIATCWATRSTRPSRP